MIQRNMRRIVKPIDWKGIIYRHADDAQIKGEFGERIVKEMLEQEGYRLSKQENRAPGLPDFRIEDTHMFVEVKSHKTGPNARPPVWQKPLFSMMVSMGWEVYVAHPRIRLGKDRVVCEDVRWFRMDRRGRLDLVDGFPVGG